MKLLIIRIFSYFIRRKKYNLNIEIAQVSHKLSLEEQIYILSYYLSPVLEQIKSIKIKSISKAELKNLQKFDFQKIKIFSKDVVISKNLLSKLKKSNFLSMPPLISLYSDNLPKFHTRFHYLFDVINSKEATWEMLNFTNRFFDNSEVISKSKKKYIKTIYNQAKSDKVLLLGTGPSIDKFNLEKYKDFDIMICNSLIKSEKISNLKNLKYIFFADPIFHSGPSKYANKFREVLNENFSNKEVNIFTPMRDYLIYKNYLSNEIFEKLYFYEIKGDSNYTYNLHNQFYVSATRNILTLAMLPFAMNNYKKIYFAGFDGNGDVKKNYYWKHSKNFQFYYELEEIKKEHPAFFNVDFEDYNEVHNGILENIIKTNGEFEFVNLTPSNIPILKKLTQ